MTSVTTVLPVAPEYVAGMVKAPGLTKVPYAPKITAGAEIESIAPKTDRPVPNAVFATVLNVNGTCTVEPSTHAYAEPASVPILHEVGVATTPKGEETIVRVVVSGALTITENRTVPDIGSAAVGTV